MATRNDLLHGTLDLLVLKTLSHGARHGYGIARFLEEATGATVTIEEGSLYPALYRLENRGFVAAEWRESDLGRRAKFYRLTPAGRRQLKTETAAWTAFQSAVSRVLLAEA